MTNYDKVVRRIESANYTTNKNVLNNISIDQISEDEFEVFFYNEEVSRCYKVPLNDAEITNIRSKFKLKLDEFKKKELDNALKNL